MASVPEVLAHVGDLGVRPEDPLPQLAAAAEFVLEGLWARRKIGRSDDRGFVGLERRSNDLDLDMERLERLRRMKRDGN